MSSMLSNFRSDLKTQIVGSTDGASLTITEARTYLTFRHADVDADSLKDDLETNGPLVTIGMVSNGSLDYHKMGDLTINFDLYIYKDNVDDWDGQDVQNLIADLSSRVLTKASYIHGPSPNTFEVIGYEYDEGYKILCYHFSVTFFDPK